MSVLTKITTSKYFKTTVIGLFVLGAIVFWWSMYSYNKKFAETEDAYVNANVVQIAPRISGEVNKLYIKNNQRVVKDAPLFSIDAEPYKVALEKAKAQLEINQAQLRQAQATAKRTLALVGKKYLSAQKGDDATASLRSAASAVKLAQANVKQATLNLGWTNIKAPSSGWVTNMTLREGDMVAAHQQVFALISDEEFWVDANFKETDLGKIKEGQKVDLTIDMYPNHSFAGVVESISGGTGTAFSLLPPQNATGNWVKVTQRVPVRIRVLNPDPKFPLRIGTSVTAKVHLQSGSN